VPRRTPMSSRPRAPRTCAIKGWVDGPSFLPTERWVQARALRRSRCVTALHLQSNPGERCGEDYVRLPLQRPSSCDSAICRDGPRRRPRERTAIVTSAATLKFRSVVFAHSPSELQSQSGTRIKRLLVLFDSEVRKRGCRDLMRTSESSASDISSWLPNCEVAR
jgi:hypothetical protein